MQRPLNRNFNITGEFLFCGIYSEKGRAGSILPPSLSPLPRHGANSENRESLEIRIDKE